MEEAASYPEAALRFMTAIGYEEYVPAVERLGINLTMLTAMPMIDLERKLGVTPKKAAVALFDECLKLRRCLHRSSTAIEVPHWLPFVLRVPHSAVNPAPKDPSMLLALRQGLDPVAKAQRPSSARGAIIGPPSGPPPTERRPGSARGPKPLTASERSASS